MTIIIPDSDGTTFINNVNTQLNNVNNAIPTTTSNLTDSTDKRFCTDVQKTVISNTSGTNTGNETSATIKSALGISTLSGSNTGDQDLSGLVVKSSNLSDVTSRQTAINNITAVSSATNEYVLTKDTTSGNAIFKAAVGGGGGLSLHAAQTTISSSGDLSTASYVKEYNPNAQGSADGIVFSPDGLKMYTIKNSNMHIYQYTLSTAWDISTAVYSGKSFTADGYSLEGSGSNGQLCFSSDGTNLYIGVARTSDNNRAVCLQVVLSTAWDISTASTVKTYSASAQEAYVVCSSISLDGTKMYLGGGNATVYQYTLSTPYDVSTATYSNISYYPPQSEGYIYNVSFSQDGIKMYIARQSQSISQYTLSTAWDVSTATYANKTLGYDNPNMNGQQLFVSPAGDMIFVSGMATKTGYVIQYSLTVYSIVFSQPFQEATYKNVIIFCNNLSIAASYVFPVPFTNVPSIVNTPISSIVTSISTTGVTVTGASSTGFIELVGY